MEEVWSKIWKQTLWSKVYIFIWLLIQHKPLMWENIQMQNIKDLPIPTLSTTLSKYGAPFQYLHLF